MIVLVSYPQIKDLFQVVKLFKLNYVNYTLLPGEFDRTDAPKMKVINNKIVGEISVHSFTDLTVCNFNE